MKTSERIHWNDRFPAYMTAMVRRDRPAMNRIAARIATDAGATVTEVHMTALNQRRAR